MQKMRQFQDLGHAVIFLVGDYTAMVGDPSGKTEMRQLLSQDAIAQNVQALRAQLQRYVALDGDNGAVIVNNADWLAELKYIDFLRDIGRHFSVNRMLTFEAYKQRLETGLSFLEFNYQLLQAYDFPYQVIDKPEEIERIPADFRACRKDRLWPISEVREQPL